MLCDSHNLCVSNQIIVRKLHHFSVVTEELTAWSELIQVWIILDCRRYWHQVVYKLSYAKIYRNKFGHFFLIIRTFFACVNQHLRHFFDQLVFTKVGHFYVLFVEFKDKIALIFDPVSSFIQFCFILFNLETNTMVPAPHQLLLL